MMTMFYSFFIIGIFTFGGGYAMIPLISDFAEANGWMSLDQLTGFIGISESTPGPFAVNIATFIGFDQLGLPGAFLATAGVVLPSFIIMLILAKYSHKYKDNFVVKSAFTGLRPATIGLIASAIYLIVITVFINTGETGANAIKWKSLIIFGALFIIKLYFKKIHPIALIGIAAGLGILINGLIP